MNYLKNPKQGGDQPDKNEANEAPDEALEPIPMEDTNEEDEESKIDTAKAKDKSFTPVVGNRLTKQLPPLIRRKGVFLIGICGGPSCGKTTLVEHIKMNLVRSIACIKCSDFYKPLLGKGRSTHSHDGLDEELEQIDAEEDHKTAVEKINKLYDFDSPDAIEFDLLIEVLKKLKENKSTTKPKYNKKTKMREENWVKVDPCDVIIVEGHLAFANKELREMFDQKIYIEADDDIRLTRRILKEKKEAEKDGDFDITKCLDKYEKFVKPAYDKYVEPTKKYADMVIPNNVQSELDNNSMSQKERNKLAINRSMLIICNVAEKVCDFVNERY
ncbi:unnamed protein product [Moneuplotes crassus]|uniref:Phosphoribulokinase/uridine kinase domain-containing protein n=1 Tax=Euplotes crassus TaxID=5936 RepID=A0AAD1U9Q4_EUPCR|nr:unnamed protein product [Moneuplotes crassus]